MAHFNSLGGVNKLSHPGQNSIFNSTTSDGQNPAIPKPGKLKLLDTYRGADSKPLPKPLMVNPNFTVKSMEARFNPALSVKPPWMAGLKESGGFKELRNDTNIQTPAGLTGSLKTYITEKGASNTSDFGSQGMRILNVPKPPVIKPSVQKEMTTSPQKTFTPLSALQTCGSSIPNKKPLPSVFALGKSPAKPKRPPHVNLDMFRRNAVSVSPPATVDFSDGFPPPPPPVDQISLEENYDDVEFKNKSSNDPEESSDEMYEDLDDKWAENNKESKEAKETNESKEQKKKLVKEEKKRVEQEKKEKKEKEKREQEAKKKFKIKGPIEVVETGKARVNHKGGKNKLPLTQGEIIEIVRKTGNPKEYWLARNSEGHYGFVKPDTVNVESGDVTHTQHDVGATDELKNLRAVTAMESDGDVYECPEDSQDDFSFPPPPPDLDCNGGGATDDTYDDVISTDFPPPPPNCFPDFSSQNKTEEMDPKKKKKFEKEEKEFRKKFKYNGDIRVLYQATILSSLSIKKFGNKDLPVKSGEIIDVIVSPGGDKLIGRNSEGKFGYVSTSYIEKDGSVYDDIGEDCIYDND